MVFGWDAWRVRPSAWPNMVEYFIVTNRANLIGPIRHLQSRRVYDNNVIRKSDLPIHGWLYMAVILGLMGLV